MKNSNIFDIVCEEGSKNKIWWRGRIECFSDSAPDYMAVFTQKSTLEIPLNPHNISVNELLRDS